MTVSEYASALKKNRAGGYLFCGEETYLLNRYLEATRKAHFEDDRDLAAFNHIRLSGENATPERILQAMESLPVFAERKLIEISSLNLGSMSEDLREDLLAVFARLPEFEYNTLLLIATPEELPLGTPKKPSPALKAFSDLLTPVFFDRQPPAKLNQWLGRHFAAWGIRADAQVCSFLLEYAGDDMFTLAAQAEKLACFLLAKGADTLTEADVTAVACAASEYDSFALADAVLNRSVDTALAILADRKRRRERPELILGGIATVFQSLLRIRTLLGDGLSAAQIAAKTGLHAYRVELYLRKMGRSTEKSLRQALELCYETDLKMKKTSLDPYALLERLVAETALI